VALPEGLGCITRIFGCKLLYRIREHADEDVTDERARPGSASTLSLMPPNEDTNAYLIDATIIGPKLGPSSLTYSSTSRELPI
jgi:hypothetical protein